MVDYFCPNNAVRAPQWIDRILLAALSTQRNHPIETRIVLLENSFQQ
jgi:hypothetical protein